MACSSLDIFARLSIIITKRIACRRCVHLPRRDRGFALLMVLWSLVLIGFLMTNILASGRTSALLARNLRTAAAARAFADGTLNEALFHVLAFGAAHWGADGRPHVMNAGSLTASVRIGSLGGKINPNLASTALLSGLFQAVGAPPAQAGEIANAIIAWRSPAASTQAANDLAAAYQRAGLNFRPPGHGFADLGELSNVIGMPPAWLAAAMPHMSLFQSGDPNPALADPLVRRALALSGQPGSSDSVYEGNDPVIVIEADVRGSDGLALRRLAIVSLPGTNAAVPFRFLSVTDDP